jgi:hydrogenase expression/formation protein HypC
MSLGVPGLVTEVDETTALVDVQGVCRRVRLDLVDEPVRVGDYVLNEVGFAIQRIPPDQVQVTLETYERLLKESEGAEEDGLEAADILTGFDTDDPEAGLVVNATSTPEGDA